MFFDANGVATNPPDTELGGLDPVDDPVGYWLNVATRVKHIIRDADTDWQAAFEIATLFLGPNPEVAVVEDHVT